MTIDKEEFLVWREHPITRAYFERVASELANTKDHWNGLVWDNQAWKHGKITHPEFAYHRSRVDTLEFMRDLEFEDIFEQEDK